MKVETVVQALRLLRTEWARLAKVVIASDAKALIEASVRRSGGDPMTGVVLLEHPALLRERELERRPGWPVRWVWVRSHSGNAHHNQVDRITYRMASEGRESVAIGSSSSLALAPCSLHRRRNPRLVNRNHSFLSRHFRFHHLLNEDAVPARLRS